MVNTSAEYKVEIAKKSISYVWYGTITLTSGVVLKFGPVDASTGYQRTNNLDQNKSKITRQYTQGETLEIGNAFSSQLVLGLRDTADLQVSDHHYEFYGAEIAINFRLYGSTLANEEPDTHRMYEDVPCGLYVVEDASFTYHTVTLTAFDYLYKASKTKLGAKMSNSNAYTALTTLAGKLGITMLTTQVEIEAMPNGALSWALSEFKKSTVVKDVLEAICACLCANAIVDRSGRLVIKPYATTGAREINDSSRYSSSYVDYLGRYTTLALENADGDEEVYSATTTYNTGKPLTINIGKNTLINKKSQASRTTIARSIINQLATVMYAPLDISIPTDPSIDIGDSLTGSHIVDQSRTDTYLFINTKDDIALYGQQNITSAGGNYELANRKKASKVEKKVSDLEQQQVEIGNNVAIIQTQISEITGMVNIGYILPTEVDLDNIADGVTREVLTFQFPVDETEEDIPGEAISFHAELCFYIDTTETNNSFGDGILNVVYTMDDVDIASSAYSYGDGWKILTLNGFFPSLAVGDHTFVVSFGMSGGAIANQPT